jgi:deoxyribonucleoside regulator
MSLESDLINAFGLRDARVVASSKDMEGTRVDLGRAAASLFDELVSDATSVGVGSGRTLFEMASRLPERPRAISIYPANLIVEQDLHLTGASANAVATIAWFRSRPSAKASRLEMFFPSTARQALMDYADLLSRTPAREDLRKKICSLDVYFLGASEFRKDSQLARLRSQLAPGSPDTSSIVGDLAFNLLDRSGGELDSRIGEMVLSIPTERLKRIARTGKSVVIAAGGEGKALVLIAALTAQLCNILVTDSDTAEELMKMKASIVPTDPDPKEEANREKACRPDLQ